MSLTRFMILFISSVITSVKLRVKICWVTTGRHFLITIRIVAETSVTIRRKHMFWKILSDWIECTILRWFTLYNETLHSHFTSQLYTYEQYCHRFLDLPFKLRREIILIWSFWNIQHPLQWIQEKFQPTFQPFFLDRLAIWAYVWGNKTYLLSSPYPDAAPGTALPVIPPFNG